MDELSTSKYFALDDLEDQNLISRSYVPTFKDMILRVAWTV